MPSNLERLDQNFSWERSPLQSELRRLMGVLEPRFSRLENQVIDWEAAVESITSVGLTRVNESLGALVEGLTQAVNVGFMVIEATGQPQTLVVDASLGFQATSEWFQLFQPTAYLLIVNNDDYTNWGMLRLDQFLKDTGELAATVVFSAKEQVGSNWTISCNAAVWQAMRDLLDATVAAKEAAEEAMATTAGQVEVLEGLIEVIQGGPVASVAGKSGVVTLELADVVGLVAALAAKADSSAVTTLLSGKQDASTKLVALAAMTWAADKVLMATAAGAIGTIDATSLGKSLLAIASVSDALDALGFSAFAKTLLDDADASTALTTLGVSAFAKTLLDDADADAARTTLGVSSGPTSVAKSTDYTVTSNEIGKVIEVTTGSSTDKTITLLAASTAGDGAVVTINKIDAGTKKVIVSDGSARAWLSAQYDEVAFRSNGTIWEVYKQRISPLVDTFTASGTYTKPPLAKAVHVDIIGGGGAGGAGGRNTSVGVYGGAGGGGGARVVRTIAASSVGSTETVTVGVAVSGPSGRGTNGNGTDGSDGNSTSFGSLIFAPAGRGGGGGGQSAAPASSGAGGGLLNAVTIAGSAGAVGLYGGASGAISNSADAAGGAGGSSANGGGGGGAGGSLITTSGTGSAGGVTSSNSPGGGGAGASSGTSGSNGASIGAGGGGGGARVASTSGAGGDGHVGAGGGGGGGSQNGTSGGGGDGGRGEATITTHF